MNLADPSTLGWWYYPLSFVLNVLDSFVAPLPQELFVLAIGPLSGRGLVSFWAAVAVAWIANVLGDVWLAWVVERYRHVLDRWRFGRWLLAKAEAGERALGERGTFAVLAGLRFISGGRTASYVAAGLAAVPRKTQWAATAVGSLAWVFFMVLIGQLTQSATGLPAWASALVGMGVGTLIGAIPALIGWARKRSQRGRRDDPTSSTGTG